MKNYIVSETNHSSSSASDVLNNSYYNSEVYCDGGNSNYERAYECLKEKQNKESGRFLLLLFFLVLAVVILINLIN